MSVYGYLFLVLGMLCGAMSVSSVFSGFGDTLTTGGTVVFAVLFTITLLLGRRIKFDPVLR
ncbi:PA3371 family protein [Stutzerimonas xanthomarina]|uniref:PA3371 family protein n=1 Tax=Stutzerimonas xanthomarina TaxID=271420 RepID=UPI003AA8348D